MQPWELKFGHSTVQAEMLVVTFKPVVREVPNSIIGWPQVSVPLTFRPVVTSGFGQDHSHMLESSIQAYYLDKDQWLYLVLCVLVTKG